MIQYNITVGVFFLCLIFLFAHADDSCNKLKCPGPTAYYQDLGCIPVYRTSNDCCPYKYNCDHLKSRSDDKCYANGHEYEIGESLRKEDGNPCDIACECRKLSEIAKFNCAVVDCPRPSEMAENCYQSRNINECCPHSVCSTNPDDRAKCIVDGKIYKDGEYFKPESEPHKECVCAPGYTGENNEQFCRNTSLCRTEFYHIESIKNNCAPAYYFEQSPQMSCTVWFRCQNANDEILRKNRDASVPETDDDMVCQFGTLLMHYGDELKQSANSDFESSCVKCVCEVGPVPTCQSLPITECGDTKHLNSN